MVCGNFRLIGAGDRWSEKVARWCRRRPTDASELLTKFRELHVRGSLSDDEYRTIKTKLATQFEAELNDNDKTS